MVGLPKDKKLMFQGPLATNRITDNSIAGWVLGFFFLFFYKLLYTNIDTKYRDNIYGHRMAWIFGYTQGIGKEAKPYENHDDDFKGSQQIFGWLP